MLEGEYLVWCESKLPQRKCWVSLLGWQVDLQVSLIPVWALDLLDVPSTCWIPDFSKKCFLTTPFLLLASIGTHNLPNGIASTLNT